MVGNDPWQISKTRVGWVGWVRVGWITPLVGTWRTPKSCGWECRPLKGGDVCFKKSDSWEKVLVSSVVVRLQDFWNIPSGKYGMHGFQSWSNPLIDVFFFGLIFIFCFHYQSARRFLYLHIVPEPVDVPYRILPLTKPHCNYKAQAIHDFQRFQWLQWPSDIGLSDSCRLLLDITAQRMFLGLVGPARQDYVSGGQMCDLISSCEIVIKDIFWVLGEFTCIKGILCTYRHL